MYLAVLIFALAAPLLLLPVEAVLPYPHLVEEIAKAVLVWFVLGEKQQPGQPQWLLAAAVGLSFMVSETILYARNFLWLGSGDQLAERLMITGSLHVGTALLLYLFGHYRRWAILIGLIPAVAIHYLVNAWLGWEPGLLAFLNFIW